jgi:aryl-alcohol dehydrogenase-like predicted oxidoreductase
MPSLNPLLKVKQWISAIREQVEKITMKSVLLGTTDVSVSALCLGTMYFGSRIDKVQSFHLLDFYIAQGGTFLDTANNYAYWIQGYQGGESEHLLGDWMKQRRNRRDLFLATKVGFNYPQVERCLKAYVIQSECEKSLRRLGIDTVDLYYAHVDDRTTPLEETLEAYDRLVKSGKVRLVGASNYTAWRMADARWVSHVHHWVEFCCIQQQHTYLRPVPGADFKLQGVVNHELMDYCSSSGLTILPYTSLMKGFYTRSNQPVPVQFKGEDNRSRLAELKAVAAELGVTKNQVVLAWMLKSSSPRMIPVIGASSIEQLEENLGALQFQLDSEFIRRLDQAGSGATIHDIS